MRMYILLSASYVTRIYINPGTYVSSNIGCNASRTESTFASDSVREWFLWFDKNWDVDSFEDKLGNSIALIHFEIFITEIK